MHGGKIYVPVVVCCCYYFIIHIANYYNKQVSSEMKIMIIYLFIYCVAIFIFKQPTLCICLLCNIFYIIENSMLLKFK